MARNGKPRPETGRGVPILAGAGLLLSY